MPSDDRDLKFERALAHRLRGGSAQAGCPDAEILAAYHERTLSFDEMASWKKHIAGCAACQEALALVETTEKQLAEEWEVQKIPVLEAAAIHKPHPASVPLQKTSAAAQATPHTDEAPIVMRSRRRPALMRWAVPLGAVAAGVLIWIGVHEQRALQSQRSGGIEVAQNRPAAQDQKLSAPEPKALPPVERDSLRTEMESKTRRQDAAASDDERRQVTPAAPTPAAGNPAKDAASVKKEPLSKFAYGGQAAAPGIPPAKISSESSADKLAAENRPALVSPPPPAPASIGSTARAGVVAAREESNAAPAPAPPPAATQTVEVTSAAPAVETSSASAARKKAKVELPQSSANLDTNALTMKQGVSSEMVQVIASDTGLILTPDNKVWWKLQPGGLVELTTDGGKKWKSLNTRASGELTSGSAPSDRVCWIAGKAGTLIRTTDRGGHWTRITTPISEDLGGVHASDAKHASIWDAANRKSYETSDGGATWKQTANE